MAGSWSSLLRTAGHSQRLGGGGGSLSGGVDYDPRALQADYSQVEANTRRAAERRRRDEEQARRQQEREQDDVNAELARQQEQQRKDAEKQAKGALDKAADDAKKAAVDREKAQAAEETRSAKAADLAGDVRAKLTDEQARQEEHNAEEAKRAKERADDQAERRSIQDENRALSARQRAEAEARSMAERIDVHEKRQKLDAEKERSAKLARPGGRQAAQKLSDQDLPVPATREPFVVSDQDRPLAEAIRGGKTEDWITGRTRDLERETARARFTPRPAEPTPLKPRELTGAAGDLQIEQTPEGVRMGSGVRAWLEGEAPRTGEENEARFKALEAGLVQPESVDDGQHAILDRTTLEPKPAGPPQAASGRVAVVAPSVRSEGLGSSNAAPRTSDVPTAADAARNAARSRMQPAGYPPVSSVAAAPPVAPTPPSPAAPPSSRPAPAPAPPPTTSSWPQPAPQTGPAPGTVTGFAPGATPFAPPTPIRVPEAPVSQRETEIGTKAAAIAKMGRDPEEFLFSQQQQLYGREPAKLLVQARFVAKQQLAAGAKPEQAVAAAQEALRRMLAANQQASASASADWSGVVESVLNPDPKAIGAFALRIGVPIAAVTAATVLSGGTLTPLALAGVGMAAGGMSELGAQSLEQGTLRPKVNWTGVGINTLGGAIPATGIGKGVTREFLGREATAAGGSWLTRRGAANAAVQAVEHGVEGGTQGAFFAQAQALADRGEFASAAETLHAAGMGATIGAVVGPAAARFAENLAARATARQAHADAALYREIAAAAGAGDESAIRVAQDLATGTDLHTARLNEMGRRAEASLAEPEAAPTTPETPPAPPEPAPPPPVAEPAPLFRQEADARARAEEAQNAKAQKSLFDEQARVSRGPVGDEVRTREDVQGMFPRSSVEGEGPFRVTDRRFSKPINVEPGKGEVSLREGTMEQTRGGKVQEGEYVAGRFDAAGPEGKLEVLAGEGRATAMHEAGHAVNELVKRGDLAVEDANALNATARFRALAEAKRRGVDWKAAPEALRQSLLEEARMDLVGEYGQIKGPGKVADTPLRRAAVKVGDFFREARMGGTAGNALERVRTGDYGESVTTRAGRRMRKGWDRASELVNPLEAATRDRAAARSDAVFEGLAADRNAGPSTPRGQGGILDERASVRGAAPADDMVDVYHGEEGASGAGGGFWTTNPKRAASFGGKVSRLRVPRSVFDAGQVEARRRGQAGPMDTYLSPEQTRGATPHDVKADVYDASGPVDRDALLKELGIIEYAPSKVQRMVPRDDLAAGRGKVEQFGEEVPTTERGSVKRYSGLPEEGRAEELAAAAAGEHGRELAIRQKREMKADFGDTYRRFAGGRSIEQVAKIQSPEGRPVGAIVAEQMKATANYGEEKSSRGSGAFDTAFKAFERLTRDQGGDVSASWRRVVDALDARKAENGRMLVGFGDLTNPEKTLYTITKAIFKQAKRDALDAGVFSGQEIRNYWPHMRDGAPIEFDDMVDAHAKWLQSPEGKGSLKKLRGTDNTWLSGLIGPADVRELAALDLAKRWQDDAWVRKNPHLEKFRSGQMTDYSTNPDVVARYLRSVYPRIAQGRFVGDKAQLVRTAVGEMGTKDRQFVTDVFQQNFGRKGPGMGGAGFDRATRELNFWQGMSKLGQAAINQLSQPASAAGLAVGRLGVAPGLKAILQATKQSFQHPLITRSDAKRSGATFAADVDETKAAFSAAGSYSERFLLDTLKLGKIPPVREAIRSTWFVKHFDAAARVYSDSMGRFAYLEALRQGNRKALTEMLGGRPEMADLALREDLPHVAELRRAIASGRSGDIAIEGGSFLRTEKTTTPGGEKLTTSKVNVPLAKGFSLAGGVERMDRAGKFWSDKTQYRTRPMDAPVMWNEGWMKFLHPFMAFPLQHWYFQKGEVKGLGNALEWKKGVPVGVKDKVAAAQHLRTLLAYNLAFAPLYGGAAMTVRALATGKGTDTRQVNETDNPFVQAIEALGPDPLANEGWDKKLLALEALQAWNFAGGVGLPLTYLERGARSFLSEGHEKDTTRALVEGVGGANAGMAIDIGKALQAGFGALSHEASGKLSRADMDELKRAALMLTRHVPVVNAPFGVGSSLRSRALEKMRRTPRPQTSPGWAGLGDEGATWNPRRGVTNPSAEERRLQNVEDWRERDEREQENAAASWEQGSE